MNDRIVKKLWLSYLYGFVTACDIIAVSIHIENTNAYDLVDVFMIINMFIFVFKMCDLLK